MAFRLTPVTFGRTKIFHRVQTDSCGKMIYVSLHLNSQLVIYRNLEILVYKWTAKSWFIAVNHVASDRYNFSIMKVFLFLYMKTRFLNYLEESKPLKAMNTTLLPNGDMGFGGCLRSPSCLGASLFKMDCLNQSS